MSKIEPVPPSRKITEGRSDSGKSKGSTIKATAGSPLTGGPDRDEPATAHLNGTVPAAGTKTARLKRKVRPAGNGKPAKSGEAEASDRPAAAAPAHNRRATDGSNPPLTTDIQSSLLESSFERAARLTENAKRLEASVAAKIREVTALQSVVARLKDEKLELERRVDELTHETMALRSAGDEKERKISSLLLATNRQQHETFWGICHFIAGSEEFEPYAESVGNDLTRLFCMLLGAEIQEALDLSAETKAHAAAIADIFDPFYYLTEYEEIAREGINPLLHYVTRGCTEGRNPTPLFDSHYYRMVAELDGGDPLLHYIMQGEKAGLKPHPLFDGGYYFSRYLDVAEQNINPLFHYQTWGGRERRDPSLVFDSEYFLESRGLPATVENPLIEYLRDAADVVVDPHPLFSAGYFADEAGISNTADKLLARYERDASLNRSVRPHPLFDLEYIKNQIGGEFPDGTSPLETFCRISQYRDIDPSPLFDSRLYRYQVEVERGRQLTEPPVIDYLKRGYKDKTVLPNLVFDPQTYRANNSFDFTGPELTHYALFGDALGFATHPLFNAGFYNSARPATGAPQQTAIEHFLTSPASERHVSHPHAGRPLLPEMLDFVRSVYATETDCDPAFYKNIYADLSSLTEAEAQAHYEENGKNEGRIGSPRAVVRHFDLRIRDLPLGFFPDEYVQLNPDLLAVGMKPEFLPAFGHYMEFGRAENRTIGKWQFYLDSIDLRIPTVAAPMSLNTGAEQIDVCVLMHLFYPDLWPELAAFAQNFDSVSRDVFVNVVDIAWTPKFQREMRELCPEAFVQLSNDNGRDIGGFIRLLDNVDIKKYDMFAFMHSKKSPHIAAAKGDYWRRCLLRAFAGSRDVVAECVQMFRDDPSLGLIGAKEWRATEMGNNEAQVAKMLDLFGIEPQHRSVEYLSGTMFLIRSDVVQRIYDTLKDVEWEYGGDKDVSFHMDGQAAHAVERVVGNLIRQMGYKMAWR